MSVFQCSQFSSVLTSSVLYKKTPKKSTKKKWKENGVVNKENSLDQNPHQIMAD